jgi:hypothetical protein
VDGKKLKVKFYVNLVENRDDASKFVESMYDQNEGKSLNGS